MSRRRSPRLVLPAGAALAFGLAAAPARAAEASSARPVIELAIGAGVSFDSEGRNVEAKKRPPMPLYLVSVGLGGGLFGGTLRLVSNAPGGSMATPEVQRLGLELLLLVRPFAGLQTESRGYGARVLRSISFGVGPGVEELILTGTGHDFRLGVVTAGHFDLPLTGLSAAPGARPPPRLALRLGARRLLARDRALGNRTVGDARLDLFGALALAF